MQIAITDKFESPAHKKVFKELAKTNVFVDIIF